MRLRNALGMLLLPAVLFGCSDTPSEPDLSSQEPVAANGLVDDLLDDVKDAVNDLKNKLKGRRQLIYGVDGYNNLVVFRAHKPERARYVRIKGTDGKIIGIDFRPNDQNPADNVDNSGKLYGVSSTSKIYIIDAKTGNATLVSTLSIALNGRAFGVGFNPVVDRLRIHSDANQNLRINVDNGLTTLDAALAYAAGDPNAGKDPDVAGTGYTNSVNPPPAATELYAVDAKTDVLVELDAPNNGQLTTVGRLGVNTNTFVGFDIPGTGERFGFASLTREKSHKSAFYTVDLDRGGARFIGKIDHKYPLVTIVVAPRDKDSGKYDDKDEKDWDRFWDKLWH